MRAPPNPIAFLSKVFVLGAFLEGTLLHTFICVYLCKRTRDGYMFKKIPAIALLAFTLPASALAAVNLNVSLGDSIKPVTHVATGSLYGLTETLRAISRKMLPRSSRTCSFLRRAVVVVASRV